ncbi:hypothetical protein ACO1O0_003980 [Amphichorda felina]
MDSSNFFQLEDPSLLHKGSLLHGDSVTSQPPDTFDVEDPGTKQIFASFSTAAPSSPSSPAASAVALAPWSSPVAMVVKPPPETSLSVLPLANLALRAGLLPTIIKSMADDMLTTREEVFGTLLGVYNFETEEEVVEKGNATPIEPTSYFFTRDVNRTWRLLESLEVGMVGMDTGNSSAAENPFGGITDWGNRKEAGKDVAIGKYLIQKMGALPVPESKLWEPGQGPGDFYMSVSM